MNKFVKHYVNDMDESMVQNCILCGETINDYRNVMYLKDQGPPKGFAQGAIYIFKNGGRTELISEAAFSPNSPFVNCTETKKD